MTLDGAAAERGFDPLELPIDRFLSWVYSWVVSRLSDKDRRRFDMELARPAHGEESPEWSDDALAADFEAAFGVMG